MGGLMDRLSTRSGRLHGNLLRVLLIISALAAAIAVWQFSSLGGDDDKSFPSMPSADPVTGMFNDNSPTPDDPEGSASANAEATSEEAEPSPEVSSEEPSPSPSTEAATTGAAETTEPEPSGPQCTAVLRVESEWRDTVQVLVEIDNTGEESFQVWEVTIVLDGAEVTNTWGMHHVEGDLYRGDAWNSWLDPGEGTDAVFQADFEDEYTIPDSVPCAASN